MKRSAPIVANPNLLPELWPLILSYLSLYQRLYLMTVCTAWGNARQGFIHQSIVSLNKHDRLPVDLSIFVNLSDLQTYWSPLIERAMSNGQLNQLKNLEILASAHTPKDPTFKDLSLLTNLTSLQMEYDDIAYLPTLIQLTNLRYLNLIQYSRYEPKTESAVLTTISALNSLTLFSQALSDTTLLGCTNLKRLTLSDNGLINPLAVGQLTQLESLNLVGITNGSYQSVLLSLTNLSSLGLESEDELKNEHITHLSSLRSLYLSDQAYLTSDILNYFPHLARLLIHDITTTRSLHDKELPNNLLSLKCLKEFQFNDAFSYLEAATLTQLTSLTRLCIVKPTGHIIQSSFRTFTNLTQLKLSDSSLANIDISYLPSSLRVLNLRHATEWYHLIRFMPQYLSNLEELTLGITSCLIEICVSFSKMELLPKLECLYYADHPQFKKNHSFNQHLKYVPQHVQTIRYS